MAGKSISEETKHELSCRIHAGENYQDIASTVGVSINTVSRYAAKLGVKTPAEKIRDTHVTICREYEENTTVTDAELAEKYNLSVQHITNILKTGAVEIRKKPRAKKVKDDEDDLADVCTIDMYVNGKYRDSYKNVIEATKAHIGNYITMSQIIDSISNGKEINKGHYKFKYVKIGLKENTQEHTPSNKPVIIESIFDEQLIIGKDMRNIKLCSTDKGVPDKKRLYIYKSLEDFVLDVELSYADIVKFGKDGEIIIKHMRYTFLEQ